jgi:hypothetical protein
LESVVPPWTLSAVAQQIQGWFVQLEQLLMLRSCRFQEVGLVLR